jgi:hypothetical protein
MIDPNPEDTTAESACSRLIPSRTRQVNKVHQDDASVRASTGYDPRHWRRDECACDGSSIPVAGRQKARPALQDPASGIVERLMAAAADDGACCDAAIGIDQQLRLDGPLVAVAQGLGWIIVVREHGAHVARGGI